jgi:hypothetical protein
VKEIMMNSGKNDYRSEFETFKSNICHHLKDMGDINFLMDVLGTDQISVLYEKRWYPEAFYLLALVDYLSKENDIPLCSKYDDIRSMKLKKTIYPLDVLLTCEVLKSDEPKKRADNEAIPEFRKYNIIESEVRGVV